VLRAVGQTNFDHYAYVPGTKEFWPDFFIEEQDGMCSVYVLPPPRARVYQALSNAEIIWWRAGDGVGLRKARL
jgi:hypothetical protein